MTVCKYFMQGTCRFGDRCRFEHPHGNSGYNDGFDLRDRIGSKGQDNYSYNQRQGGNYGGYQNQNYNSGNQGYNNRNYNNYQSGGYYNSNKQQQNQGELTTQEVLQSITQDMQEWERTKSMWLYSCYAFTKDTPSIPDLGLDDVSPEEVRLKAYEAEASGNQTQYKNWYYQTKNEYETKRSQLMKPNVTFKVKLVELIDAILKSSNSSSSPSTSPPFGASASTGGFGSSNFGSSSIFGGSSNQTTSPGFGGGETGSVVTLFTNPPIIVTNPPANNSNSSSGFAAFGNQGKTAPNGLFGYPYVSSGNHTVSQPTAGLFGNPTNPGIFGSSSAPQPDNKTNLFAGVSNPGVAFGTTQGVTGSTASQPSLFNSFTSQASAFAQVPSAQVSGFGSTSGGFGQTQTKPMGQTGQSKSSTYSTMDELSSEERTAFEAPKFILGKIPTKPPPRELI